MIYVSMFYSCDYDKEIEVTLAHLEMFIMEAYFHDRILLCSQKW